MRRGDERGACDRMKTAVLGEDADRSAVYNPSLVALLDHYGSAPKACKACRAKTKGKVERPFRCIRQDFFLDRTFRCLDDLNAQFDDWRGKVANPRVHATTGRIVDQAFAEEQGCLIPLPAHPYDAVLTVERRVSRDGMVSAQARKHRDRRHLVKVVARRVALARILHPIEYSTQFFHCLPLRSARRGCCRLVPRVASSKGKSNAIAVVP